MKQLLFLLLLGHSVAAQNLISNGSFEQFVEEDKSFNRLSNWYNPGNQQALPPTPDHLSRTTTHRELHFAPHSGTACTGFILYMLRQPQYREFAAIALNEPLEVGAQYSFSIWLSHADTAGFGSMAGTGFGLGLSEQRITQPANQLPQVQVVATHPELFYQYGWRKWRFTFTATAPHKHLLLGNLLPTEQLQLQHLRYDTDPQVYLLIDDVELVKTDSNTPEEELPAVVAEARVFPSAIEAPAEADEVGATVKKTEQRELEQHELQNRQVRTDFTLRLKEQKVRIRLFDGKQADGDRVSLLLDGKPLISDIELRNRSWRTTLHLKPGTYLLELYAHNLGEHPPNTATVQVKSGKLNRSLRLNADLETSAAIRLVVE